MDLGGKEREKEEWQPLDDCGVLYLSGGGRRAKEN